MNIGIVTTWFERGAAYVSRQYRNILQKNNDVFIYVRGGEEYEIGNPNWDDTYVTWGKKLGSGISTEIQLNHFKKWLLVNKIEIILFNEQNWLAPVLLCNELNIKTGAYIDYYKENTIELFSCYDFLICNTKKHYETFKWHKQAFFVQWGTDIDLYKCKSFDAVNKDSLTFFHSCGYNPRRKGTDLLIKAFNKIDNKQKKLVIHSQCDLKEKLPELNEIISELEIKNNLTCIVKTVTAPGLYQMGDVYVYPTRLEGIGLTIAEALSSGLPVITNNYSPMNEFILDGINGRLVGIDKYFCRNDGYYWPLCESDIDSLRKCMEYYINNFSEIKSMKMSARNFAETNLDWRERSDIIINIFNNVKKIENENYYLNLKKINQIQKSENFKIKMYSRYGFFIRYLKKYI